MTTEEPRALCEAATPIIDPSLPGNPSGWIRWCLECGCDVFTQHCEQCDARRKVRDRALEKDPAVLALGRAARTALPALLDENAALRDQLAAKDAAWRTVNEWHKLSCQGPRSSTTCTCGLHARQAEARKVLDGR